MSAPDLIDGRGTPDGTAAAYLLNLTGVCGGPVEGLVAVRILPPATRSSGNRKIFNPALRDYEIQRIEGRRGVAGSYRVTLTWERDPRDLPIAEDLTAWHAASLALLDLAGGPHELHHLAPGFAPPGHSFGAGRPYNQPPIPTWHPTDARATRAAP